MVYTECQVSAPVCCNERFMPKPRLDVRQPACGWHIHSTASCPISDGVKRTQDVRLRRQNGRQACVRLRLRTGKNAFVETHPPSAITAFQRFDLRITSETCTNHAVGQPADIIDLHWRSAGAQMFVKVEDRNSLSLNLKQLLNKYNTNRRKV